MSEKDKLLARKTKIEGEINSHLEAIKKLKAKQKNLKKNIEILGSELSSLDVQLELIEAKEKIQELERGSVQVEQSGQGYVDAFSWAASPQNNHPQR